METEEIKAIVEQAIDARFYCEGSECEAGHLRVQLDRIEKDLNNLIVGSAELLIRIDKKLSKQDE